MTIDVLFIDFEFRPTIIITYTVHTQQIITFNKKKTSRFTTIPAGRAVENGYRWDIIICPGTKNKYHKYGSDFNALASFFFFFF